MKIINDVLYDLDILCKLQCGFSPTFLTTPTPIINDAESLAMIQFKNDVGVVKD